MMFSHRVFLVSNTVRSSERFRRFSDRNLCSVCTSTVSVPSIRRTESIFFAPSRSEEVWLALTTPCTTALASSREYGTTVLLPLFCTDLFCCLRVKKKNEGRETRNILGRTDIAIYRSHSPSKLVQSSLRRSTRQGEGREDAEK